MSQKPNILIITNHDSGRHFGCYGVETVHTPAIDALAADGMKFENYFATVPLCSPSRGAIECPAVQLFDLQKDPNEFHNVAEDPNYADVRAELDGRLWTWLEEVGDPILKGSVPTPYYRRLMAEAGRRRSFPKEVRMELIKMSRFRSIRS